ncbi:MAG TPA: S4 domain-containing protein, partial [Verrucomicrobiae bacterium]
GLVSSRSEARRLIQGGGIYVNGQRVGDPQKRVTKADFMQEKFAHIILKRGKDFMVIRPV